MDYNPYETENWIYDKVLTRENAELFHTTYRDNPFLPAQQVAEIEAMEALDSWYWQVYGLGNRAANPAQIFRNFRAGEIPEEVSDGLRTRPVKALAGGLDWGFSADPTAVVLMWEGATKEVKTGSGLIISKPEIFIKEVLYRQGMTNPEIAQHLKEVIKEHKLKEDHPFICDSADPKSIEEVRRHGINAKPAQKGPDSVRQGIQLVQQFPIVVSSGSENWFKEGRSYKWMQDKNGNTLNTPVDKMNHLMDATRYAFEYEFGNKFTGKYVIG
jgi:phage terminase large subunit